MADPSTDELLSRIAEQRKRLAKGQADPLLVKYGEAAQELERRLTESIAEAPPPGPRPEDFGLTAQNVDFFKLFSRRDYLPEKVEAALFAMAAMSAASFLIYRWGGKNWGWAILCGVYFGLALVYLVKKVRNWKNGIACWKLPNYPNYLRYEEACEKHSICLDALQSARQRAETDKQIARQQQLRKEVPKWRGLDGKGFERELVELFRQRGYGVKWTGRSGGDEGVDILLKGDGKKIIVQCKAHKNYVSPGAVRDLYGTLMHQGADEAWLITTSGFFHGSKLFAKGKPIRLLTIRDVLAGEGLEDAPARGPHGIHTPH